MKKTKFLATGLIIITIMSTGCSETSPQTQIEDIEITYNQSVSDHLRYTEATARAMVTSWNAYYFIWQQYRQSEDIEEQNKASNALIQTNQTAYAFNNFMQDNNYIWTNGIPSDLAAPLPIINLYAKAEVEG